MSSTRRIPGGLPSNPRSRIARPSSPHVASHQLGTSPTQKHPQKATLTQRGAFQTASKVNLPHSQNDYHGRTDTRDYGYTSSISSSKSSFWTDTNGSNHSSRTTLRDFGDPTLAGYGNPNPDNLGVYQGRDAEINPIKNSSPVWDRVAVVANVITQEVSKVWSTGLSPLNNIALPDDEGGESHLTFVMRAYHLSKARHPGDLPDWLFSEKERGRGGVSRSDPLDNHSTQERENHPAQQAEPRNRPDIYQVNRTKDSEPLSNNHRFLHTGPSRGTTFPGHKQEIGGSDRLKVKRELRRKPPTANFPSREH
ncbi:hypothetical protein B0H34DRAFT_694731 [Crassisporium funariophilum]|nr:hypothetical protein B0H34DRAFT_694731 [Crassisporium funariophilum]